MDKLKKLTDEEILKEYDRARGNMAYFNAAEGKAWVEETKERNKVKVHLNKVREELNRRRLKARKIHSLY